MQAVLRQSQQTESAAIKQASPEVKAKFGLKFWLFLVVFIATVLEGIVFNHFYFRFAWGDYQTVSVPLPYHEQLGENVYVFSPKQKSLVLQGLDVELMTVGFKLKGEHTLLNGTLALTDDSSIVAPIFANKFKVAPSDINTSGLSVSEVSAAPYKFLVRSIGKARSISISFEQLNGVVILTDLTLNVAPEYYFSWLRWLALTLLGSALVLVWRLRLYRLRVGELSSRSFRLVQGLSLAMCLSVSLGYSYLMLPSHISPNLLFDYTEHGYIYLGNPKQSLLLDFPRTPQELEYHDAYVQNLDAMLKGQLNIDVAIDTDVLNAAHDERLYDYGWRTQNGIEGFWDRSFYDGKIYAYYGYGPILLFYGPLYLLTGQAPSPTLAITFFSVVAILGLYLGTYAIARFYGVLTKANVLIWGLGQAAAVLGTHLVTAQCDVWFYVYANQMCAGLLGLLAYLVYTLPSLTSLLKKRCCLVALGMVIVLIVQTRPHMIIPALVLVAPVLWGMVRASQVEIADGANASSVAYRLKDKLLDALCITVPVALGAAITMTLNYLRFDSVFEFGQRFCLTGLNLLFDRIEVNFELICAALEQFVTRSWVDLVDFPYYGIMTEMPHHVGTFLLAQSSVGLLASPVWWGLALVVLLFTKKDLGSEAGSADGTMSASFSAVNRYAFKRSRMLKVSLVSLIMVMLAMCYVQFTVVALTVRYLMENLAPLVGFVVVLWVKFIGYDPKAPLQAKICYWGVIWALVMTLMMESLAPFSEIEQFRPYLIPDEWLSAQTFFTPFSAIR